MEQRLQTAAGPQELLFPEVGFTAVDSPCAMTVPDRTPMPSLCRVPGLQHLPHLQGVVNRTGQTTGVSEKPFHFAPAIDSLVRVSRREVNNPHCQTTPCTDQPCSTILAAQTRSPLDRPQAVECLLVTHPVNHKAAPSNWGVGTMEIPARVARPTRQLRISWAAPHKCIPADCRHLNNCASSRLWYRSSTRTILLHKGTRWAALRHTLGQSRWTWVLARAITAHQPDPQGIGQGHPLLNWATTPELSIHSCP
jgi:hypothetical protein